MEEPLRGGDGGGVSRVGRIVRRRPGPAAAAVHALLCHLRDAGFDGAPLPLGFDDQGREVLTFIEGEVFDGPVPDLMWGDPVLENAGSFLRRFHDATVGFEPPADTPWVVEQPGDLPVEVMCHNDVALYNVVFRDGRIAGIIDFDAISPGARVWDVAHAAYRFVPLSRGEAPAHLAEPSEQARRLRLFCDAYGLKRDARVEVADVVVRRVAALRDLLVEGAADGDEASVKHLAEGDAALYEDDVAYVLSIRATLEAALV